jgi:hypothetical protein
LAEEERFMLETPAVADEVLRCTFQRSGDRFIHQIESLLDGEATLMFSSVEGEPNEPWPPGPPWQELHVHEQPDGSSALMLVGQAGKSHWSMSVTVDNDANAIVFDVACRVRETPAFLGCTYLDHWGGTGLQPVQLTALSADVLESRPTSSIDTSENRVAITPGYDASPPMTVRWDYAIQIDHGGSR